MTTLFQLGVSAVEIANSSYASCNLHIMSLGWTMVFKIVSGVQSKRVWELYSSSDTSAENVTAALDVTNQHHDHYKNRVIMNWGNFNPSQVSVGNCTNH